MKKRRRGTRYITENMNSEQLREHYTKLYAFWKSVGDTRETTKYKQKMEEEQ